MSRVLLPASGYSTNPATEVGSNIVGIVEFLEIDLPSGTLYLTSGPGSYTWGDNTYTPVTATGMPYGMMSNMNEATDGVPRPMSLTLSGVDSTLISNLVNYNVQWVPIIWSVGLLDNQNNLLNSTAAFSVPMFLGDVTITQSANKGSITINAESMLADLQNRHSGMLQTVADQQSRGPSGNDTFSTDTFYEFAASLTYVWIYWGMQGPAQIGVAMPYGADMSSRSNTKSGVSTVTQ